MPPRRRRPSHLRVVETDDGNPTGEARRVVKIRAGERSGTLDQDVDLYEHGDFVVEVAPQEIDIGDGQIISDLRIVKVGIQRLRELITKFVDLRRYDKRLKAWVSVDCPTDLAEAYLERVGHRKLRQLRGVMTAPSLRPDGSTMDQPGYDPATGVYYDPLGVEFPRIPPAPTRDDALAALDRLDCLYAQFDFVNEASRSTALSGAMSAVERGAIEAAPMHGIDAPVPGSGKSKVVRCAAIIATGHPAAVTALGQRDEETEKRLGAALFAGDAIITLDNAERPLGGELLCQLVTEPLINVRILGTSSRLIVSNMTTWFATGNNLTFTGDMVRRALICPLDPGCGRPELREFETPDPCLVALEERPALVAAILTIAVAFSLAGCPRSVPPLGSFAGWSRWVRDPLIWLGRADPVDSMERVRGDDPRLSALTAVIEQWSMVIRDRRVTAREIAEIAGQQGVADGFAKPDFREAFLAVAGERGEVNTVRLGRWLGKNKERQILGKRIMAVEKLNGIARWELQGRCQPE